MKNYFTRKKAAAREFVTSGLGEVQGSMAKQPTLPTLNHPCKIKHRWKLSKYNRRCGRCGIEEPR